MHPACHWHWRRGRRASGYCGGFEAWPGCGPRGHGRRGDWEPADAWEEGGGGGGGGGFGVRRPLRFLAHKLGLDEPQIAEFARILNELKTERAQGEVDARRTVSAFADAVSGDAFDAAKAGEAGALRVKSAERLRDAVLKALQQIHAVLNPDQRVRLAYLIRTGMLTL
jgi:Spy/CpxP family protein refolding chaperone